MLSGMSTAANAKGVDLGPAARRAGPTAGAKRKPAPKRPFATLDPDLDRGAVGATNEEPAVELRL